MIVLDGIWYDGKTSAQLRAVLKVLDHGTFQVEEAETGKVLRRQSGAGVHISDRIGDTPRALTFSGGAVFETEANAAVDRVLAGMRRQRRSRWVHGLESKKRHVMIAGLLVLLIGAGLVRYGIPTTARLLAAVLPHSLYENADRQTLALLDRALLKESELGPEVQQRVRQHLQLIVDEHPDLGLNIVFRKGGRLGPNAFALPGGTILFTDEMITIAEHDDELTAVMAHETGHVAHRHAMRRIVQDSLLSFTLLALTGDASGAAELFLGLPVMLTELAYSRQFERDADRYTLDYLHRHRIPASRFADLLERLDQRRKKLKGPKEGWSGYLATHPSTPERIREFR